MTTILPDLWITCPKPYVKANLFCFPYAGGGASVYRTWTQDLSLPVELFPIQLPGHESRFRESLLTRLEPLVATLAEHITPFLERPFAFFDHSMGASVSFELVLCPRSFEQRVAHPLTSMEG